MSEFTDQAVHVDLDKEDHELPNKETRCEEAKWRRLIKAHEKEVTDCLNPLELIPYFDCHNLLSPDDKEVLLKNVLTRREKVFRILAALESSEARDTYTAFFKCLTEEVDHIGHRYLVAVLKGEHYATADECQASEACKRHVLEHRKDMRDIDLPSLVPWMFAYELITPDERDMLLDTSASRTRIGKIEQLFVILETKGPLAHAVFAQCLGKETSHSSHAELHKKVADGSHDSVSRKRKVSVEEDGVLSIPKRRPARIRMEEPLCGEGYSMFVADIQDCYRSGLWTQLEKVAQNFVLVNEDPQLKAVAIIEKGYSFSCRGMREMAMKYLDEAWCIARQIEGDNRYFLMARCRHIRGTMYRYSGEDDKSLKENEEASDLLFNCERADDASRVKYGEACARLEKLGKTPNPRPQEVMDTEDAFTLAIVYSRNGNPGMCASEARCLIRLAQLSLGTNTHRVCEAKATSENIKVAKGCLDKVDINSVSRRCMALYYIIESDLFRSMDNVTKAIESVKKALKIAQEDHYRVEQHSAKSRLQALQ